MSEQSFPIQIREEHSPNATFFQWLKSNTALFVSQIAAIISLILYIGTFVYYVVGHDSNSPQTGIEGYLEKAEGSLFLLNIIFCLIFVLVSLYVLNKNDEGSDHVKMFYRIVFTDKLEDNILLTAQKQLKQFKKLFLSYWVYALLFYLISLLFEEKNSDNITPRASFENVKYLFLLLGNVMIVILYMCVSKMILSNQCKYIYSKTSTTKGNKKSHIPLLLKIITPITLYVLISALPFVYKPRNATEATDWFQLLNLISGIIKMILLSILISRFDSKLIGLPSWLVSVLYIYAAIQPLEVTLGGSDFLSRCINISNYAITFIIKIYFFLMLTYVMQTGRMLNFFCCNGEMSKRLHESRNSKSYVRNKEQ